MLFEPLRWQFAHGKTKALTGEIGAASLFRDEEAAQLDNEFETL